MKFGKAKIPTHKKAIGAFNLMVVNTKQLLLLKEYNYGLHTPS